MNADGDNNTLAQPRHSSYFHGHHTEVPVVSWIFTRYKSRSPTTRFKLRFKIDKISFIKNLYFEKV